MKEWKWGQIKLSGFQNEFQEGHIEITPDAGIPFRRQRFTDIQDIVQGSFTLDKLSYIDFISWYKSDILQGALPFKYYDARIDRERVARIVDKPSYISNSKYYDVNITMTFDSEIFYLERLLAANPIKSLEANGLLLISDLRRVL